MARPLKRRQGARQLDPREVELKKVFSELWRPHRFKVFYGGRGSGKSWQVAEALIVMANIGKIKVLCCREIQASIRDSSYSLLKGSAERLGLGDAFEYKETEIVHKKTGSTFIFKGLFRNEQSVKSTEGVDICWVEESQTITSTSLDTLIPTIRKEGSEIWFTFNPLNANDPVYERFVKNPSPEVYSRKVNFDENPFFPDELRKEMLWDKQNDYDKYLHIWEGYPRTISDAQVFKDKFIVESFDDTLYKKADRLYYGSDFGFASSATTLVRCFVIDRKLYVDYEAYGVGIDLDDMGTFYAQVPDAHKWPIYADSARPETINHIRNKFGYNISAAEKGKSSVEDGIAFIRSFEKIVIHPRCKHTAQEFTLYSYKVDKYNNKEVLPIVVKEHDHCIDAIRYALFKLVKNQGSCRWAKVKSFVY